MQRVFFSGGEEWRQCFPNPQKRSSPRKRSYVERRPWPFGPPSSWPRRRAFTAAQASWSVRTNALCFQHLAEALHLLAGLHEVRGLQASWARPGLPTVFLSHCLCSHSMWGSCLPSASHFEDVFWQSGNTEILVWTWTWTWWRSPCWSFGRKAGVAYPSEVASMDGASFGCILEDAGSFCGSATTSDVWVEEKDTLGSLGWGHIPASRCGMALRPWWAIMCGSLCRHGFVRETGGVGRVQSP